MPLKTHFRSSWRFWKSSLIFRSAAASSGSPANKLVLISISPENGRMGRSEPQTTTLFSANQWFMLRTSIPGEHHLPLFGSHGDRTARCTLRNDLRIATLHKAALDDHAGVPVDSDAKKALDRIPKKKRVS